MSNNNNYNNPKKRNEDDDYVESGRGRMSVGEMMKRRRQMSRSRDNYNLITGIVTVVVILLIVFIFATGIVDAKSFFSGVIEWGQSIGQKIADFFMGEAGKLDLATEATIN